MKQLLFGVAILAVAAATARPLAQGAVIQRVLVKVNGEIFTQKDLEELQIQELQDRNKLVKSAQDLQNDATLRDLLVELTPKILAKAIDELILVQRASELGYKVTEAQFKDAIDGIKKENKLDDAQLKVALAQQGMTIEDLRGNIERMSLISMIQSQEIMSRVAMTEEEAKQYYDKHPNEFLSPPTVTLREIMVKRPPAPTGGGALTFQTASDAAPRAAIDAALARVRKGEDFGAVATEVSEAASKANGGLLGLINIDDLAAVVRDALDKVPPGGVTEVIRTAAGFQILKVEARTTQTVMPFAAVHEKIMQKVYDERRVGETRKYLERLRLQALIEWKDENLKKLYESRTIAK